MESNEKQEMKEMDLPALTLIQIRHLIKAHQLVASGLQGIWTYSIKAFLEEFFLPSNALFNIMSTSAKRYISKAK